MIRKRTGFAVSVFVVALSCSAYATIGQLEGKWKNVDSSTNGITTLEIQVSGNKVTVHAWGKCSPTDCDWGTVDATAYAPDVSSPLPSKAHALSAVFKTNFDETRLIIDTVDGNKLRVESMTHFTDNSGRSNYSAVYHFAH
jgi:hypothetical protein